MESKVLKSHYDWTLKAAVKWITVCCTLNTMNKNPKFSTT